MNCEFDRGKNLIVARWRSVFSEEVFQSMVSELAKIEEEAPVTPNRITDLTDITWFDLKSLESLVALRSSARLKNHVRSAIVANSQIQCTYARMYQALLRNPLIEVRIYADWESAMKWVAPVEDRAPPA